MSKSTKHKKRTERQKRGAEIVKEKRLEQERADKKAARRKQAPIILKRAVVVVLSIGVFIVATHGIYEYYWSLKTPSERIVSELSEMTSVADDAFLKSLATTLQKETGSQVAMTAYRGCATGDNKALTPYLIEITTEDDEEVSVTDSQLVYDDEKQDFVTEEQEVTMRQSELLAMVASDYAEQYIESVGANSVCQTIQIEDGFILMVASDTSSLSELSLILDRNSDSSFAECVYTLQQEYKYGTVTTGDTSY